jgi:hypothetical protein
MNNPFDLATYKPQLDMRDQEKARRSAYQMTHYINEKRKQGIEPSAPYSASVGGVPQDYAMDMPTMPLHKRSEKRSRKNKGKNT